MAQTLNLKSAAERPSPSSRLAYFRDDSADTTNVSTTILYDPASEEFGVEVGALRLLMSNNQSVNRHGWSRQILLE